MTLFKNIKYHTNYITLKVILIINIAKWAMCISLALLIRKFYSLYDSMTMSVTFTLSAIIT